MNFPVFSQLAGNFGFPETGSLETASSGEESANHQFLSGGAHQPLNRRAAVEAPDMTRAVPVSAMLCSSTREVSRASKCAR